MPLVFVQHLNYVSSYKIYSTACLHSTLHQHYQVLTIWHLQYVIFQNIIKVSNTEGKKYKSLNAVNLDSLSELNTV